MLHTRGEELRFPGCPYDGRILTNTQFLERAAGIVTRVPTVHHEKDGSVTFSPPSARSRRSTFWAVMALAVMAIFAFSGSAGASPLDTSGTASPWIQSDQADYSPGSTVTLTGGGFDANESVHINVNDTLGKTWVYNVDVIADANGDVSESFALPNTFVSDYDVTATGLTSGGVARTTFTDGNIASASIGIRKPRVLPPKAPSPVVRPCARTWLRPSRVVAQLRGGFSGTPPV